MKKKGRKCCLALAASLWCAGLGVSQAANLIEFRDRENQFAVYITTPANQLFGAKIDAGDLDRGTLSDSRLSSQVTKQGNTFNGVSQLIQTNGSGQYPALDGSLITNILATNIGADSVGTTQIIDSTITASDLGTDSVGSDEIVAGAVGSSEIGTDAVGSDEISAGAVGSSEIGTDAVGSDELAANAVGSSELASSGVGAGAYGSGTKVSTFTVDADGRLTGAGEVDVTPPASSITAGTLASDVVASSVAANTIDGSQVVNNSLTADDLAADSVGASEIASGAVGSSEIDTDAVGSDEIAAGAVGSSEIGTDAVGSDELAANAVGSSELASSGVGAGSYGSTTKTSTFTVDADGRITGAGELTITPAAASVQAGTFSGSFVFGSALEINGMMFSGAYSNAGLQGLACSTHPTKPCMAINTTDFDMYTSVGSNAGEWRNSRTGVTP